MGMNIYTLDGTHIGKRWAAGVWCWECKIEAKDSLGGRFWFCPRCGKRCSEDTLSYNPAFRELGFDRSRPRKHVGIDGASGFIWQIGIDGLGKTIKEVRERLKRRRFVKTEYGEKWSIKQFWEMFKDIIVEEKEEADFS